jgi:hypothetical protein
MSDDVEIYFNESLTPDQRELVEQSITSAVARTRAEADAARARSVEEGKLHDAIMAPIEKMIRADPAAAEAIERLGTRKVEMEDSLHSDASALGERDLVIPMSPTIRSVEVRLPPHDFAWRWFGNNSDPPFSMIGDREGRLGVDARAGGLISGGTDRYVNAHIGVGCIVRLDRQTVVELSATRDTRHSFVVGSRGVGSSATSEGGLETTFMRGGDVLMLGTLPLWSRRVNGFDEARDRTNFTRGTYPNGMGGRFDPGDYAFNVGMWAFADFSSGVGSAGVQSLCQSNIIEMRILRR